MSRKSKIIFITILMGLIGILHYACPLLLPDWPELHFVIIKFFFIPIILGAYWWGLWGGGILSLVSAAFYGPDLMRHWGSGHFNPYEKVAEIVLFLGVGGLLGALSDSERRTKKEKVISDQRAQAEFRKAITDPLTGAFNRRYLASELEEIWKRAKEEGDVFSLFMIDLNRFKSINDHFGHQAGDQVLQSTARFLFRHVRSTDLVFRYGGDEFMVILPKTPQNSALLLAQRLQEKAGELKISLPNQETINLDFSIGIIEFASHHKDIGEMISKLDNALYRAKKEATGICCG